VKVYTLSNTFLGTLPQGGKKNICNHPCETETYTKPTNVFQVP